MEKRLRPKRKITLQTNDDDGNGIEYSFLPSETYRYVDYRKKDYSGQYDIYDVYDPNEQEYGLDSDPEDNDYWIGNWEIVEDEKPTKNNAP